MLSISSSFKTCDVCREPAVRYLREYISPDSVLPASIRFQLSATVQTRSPCQVQNLSTTGCWRSDLVAIALFREWETNVGYAMGLWPDKLRCPIYPAFNYRRYSGSNTPNRARRCHHYHLEFKAALGQPVLISLPPPSCK